MIQCWKTYHSLEMITPRLKDGIASKFHRTETQLFLAPNGSNNDHKKFWKISLGPLRDFSILRILTPQIGKMGYYIELIIEKLENHCFKLLFKSYWRNRIKSLSSTLQFNAILTIKISNWDYWWYHNHSMVRRQKLSLAQLSLPPIKFYWKILLTGNSESLPNQTRGYQLANPTKITTQWNELRKSLNWYMILNRRTLTLIV